MKLFNKFTPAIITSCLLTVAVFANQTTMQNTDYSFSLSKNCQVIGEYQMTPEQVSAYIELKEQEEVMQSLQAPIELIQDELNEFTEQISELTSLAIQESEDSLYIDKRYLAQQEEVVEKLNLLMKAHKKDFDALGSQGNLIGDIANKFTDSLKLTIGDIDYDQLHVNSTNNEFSNSNCYYSDHS